MHDVAPTAADLVDTAVDAHGTLVVRDPSDRKLDARRSP